MQSQMISLLLTVAFALMIIGCRNNEKPGPDFVQCGIDQFDKRSTLTAIINGQAYCPNNVEFDGEAISSYVSKETNGATSSDSLILIKGIGPRLRVGTYTVEGEEIHASFGNEVVPSYWAYFTDDGSSGTLSVTEYSSDRIRGTFEFVLIEIDENAESTGGPSLIISDGKFDIVVEDNFNLYSFLS